MTQEKPLNADAAAEYLHISKDHLYKLTSEGKISHYKPGGKRIYFYQSDLDDFIKSGRVKTAAELEAEAADHIVNEGV